MKKLVYILNFVSETDTQHYVHVLRLLHHLGTLGWKVVVLSEKGGDGCRQVMGCEVRYLSRTGGPIRLVNMILQLSKLRREGFSIVFVRISRPAAIVTALLSPFFGLRGLFWMSGTILDFDHNSSRIQRINRWLQIKFIIHGMRAIVTGPETMIDYYRQNLSVPAQKMRLLYNDIDLRSYPESAANAVTQNLTLLMVHRLSPVRQTDRYLPHILAAMDLLADRGIQCRLQVVGDGPERPTLEKIVTRHKSDQVVQFLGAIPNNALNDYYDRADIFLMPSYREGFPRVILEAMSKGLPIVTTDAGGVRDILGPIQRQFMSPRSDPKQFSNNLVRLALDAHDRIQAREENIITVQKYSTPKVAQMFERLLLSFSKVRD